MSYLQMKQYLKDISHTKQHTQCSLQISGGSTIALGGRGGGGGGGGGRPLPPPNRYKMPPLLLNCRPPSHYDVHINTTRVTVFPHSGDVIHSQLSGIVSSRPVGWGGTVGSVEPPARPS